MFNDEITTKSKIRSLVADCKSPGDSAQRCRVSRNGVPQAGRRKGAGRRAGACRCWSLFPRRPSPPVPSGGPRHSAANAVSSGTPCILGRTSAVVNAVEPSHCGGSTTMTPHCGGSTAADILTHLAPCKYPTSRQGRKPGRTMRHTTHRNVPQGRHILCCP